MQDPMQTMKSCKNLCEEVPDEVYDAVFSAFDAIPGESQECREARADAIAARMAKEGWRFCPCFPTKRTSHHERIFDLVHTNMANRLAHRILLSEVAEQPTLNRPRQFAHAQ
jgi:hypothetical protein